MNNLSNISEFTVSELNQSLKEIIENNFNIIKVSGELSQVKKHNSGHVYFTLKDEESTISCICWRSTVPKLKIDIEEGTSVLILGKVTTYSPQSKYQIIVDNIEYEGEGYLLKILEDRKKKLLSEGLFDAKFKKSLPMIPSNIGIITSESGSVIQDIIHRIRDRFPLSVSLYFSKVQGKDCVKEIVEGINYFNTDLIKKSHDLIIIARGGGSLEDLMPFNDETLVRTIFQSEIPIVSAIGHETDTTLCDFVADLRAPTPTAAAELVLPDRKEILKRIHEIFKVLDKSLKQKLSNVNYALKISKSKLPDINLQLNKLFQNIDFVSQKLVQRIEQKISNSKLKFFKKHGEIKSDKLLNILNFGYEKIKNSSYLLNKNLDILIKKKNEVIDFKSKELDILSYKKTLKRGFSVVRHNKKIINDDKMLKKDDVINIEFFKNKTTAKKI